MRINFFKQNYIIKILKIEYLINFKLLPILLYEKQ
jgi:hypothetical protein